MSEMQAQCFALEGSTLIQVGRKEARLSGLRIGIECLENYGGGRKTKAPEIAGVHFVRLG
jgi:hypothetical protein